MLSNVNYTGLSFLFALLVPCAPQGSPLRYGILLLQVTFVVQAFIAAPPSNVPNTAVIYTSGVLMGNILLRYVDRIYLRVPESAFHRIRADGTKEDASKLSPIRRFLWVFELVSVTRGIGWNWRVSGIPRISPQTRAQFLRTRLVKYVVMYAGLYLTGLSCRSILNGFINVSNPQLRNALLSLTSNTVFLYVFIVLGSWMTVYSHFAMFTLPLSLLCVGLKIGPSAWQHMESWPPNFGSLKEAYSIRRFWGYTWHQQLRRTTGVPGSFLLSLMPRPFHQSRALPARLLKRYFLVFASFLASGFIHACGSYNVTRVLNLPISDGGELKYFMLQGVALMVEDFGCWLLGIDDRVAPTRTRKWLGYMVTATWYIWSRVMLRAVPMLSSHGAHDERGPLFSAVEVVERGAVAVPGNFVTAAISHWGNSGLL